jgi:hypothetical protein
MRGFFSGIRLLLLGFGSMLVLQADEARLLRFPALHGNQVVFT